ncbi:MAG: hypothetical protein DPW18_13755 [Chloroflexi bacterium]|nr:hypothetical protein [Chloroflexota bacterium]MDL1944456.1 hypothetical protein [Chloroflexi bacterium CFX2]
MYYVLKPILATWKSESIHAKIKDAPPRCKPHWWDAAPLAIPLPLLTFKVNSEWRLPDNLFTGTIFDLYSIKFIEVLRNAGVHFETFPAIVTDQFGNDTKVKYRIFHLLEKYPCLDQSRSEIDNEALEIRKLVLDKKFMALRKLMFRLEELSQFVLVHQDLKDVLEKTGITGCSYTPLDKYRAGPYFHFDHNQKDKPN